jgi:hypothetical protein
VEGGTVVKAKTLVLSLILATAFLAGLPAFDWGGTIDNSTTLSYTGSDQWLQEDKLALWFATPIGSYLEFTIQGSYTFSYTQPGPIEHILDIDLLHLEGAFLLGQNKSSQLRFIAGRFPNSDMTGLVLNDRMDGLTFEWITAVANTSVSIGYTGLQLEPVSTISISSADNTDKEDPALAPPRLIGSLQAQFPELFLRQDLFVSALIQQDLREEGATFPVDGLGGKISSQYFGLAMGGPVVSSLYHKIFAYLGTGSAPSNVLGTPEYAPILSLLTGFTLRYFMEEFLSSKVELGMLIASGDEDFDVIPNGYYEGNTLDRANVFIPISRQQLAVAFSPRLGNLIVLDAGYSLKPRKNLQTALKGYLFLRPTSGPIMDARTINSDSKYLGTELDGIVNFRPFSDLGASLALGLFLPMGGAFANQDVLFKGQLEISFSF